MYSQRLKVSREIARPGIWYATSQRSLLLKEAITASKTRPLRSLLESVTDDDRSKLGPLTRQPLSWNTGRESPTAKHEAERFKLCTRSTSPKLLIEKIRRNSSNGSQRIPSLTMLKARKAKKNQTPAAELRRGSCGSSSNIEGQAGIASRPGKNGPSSGFKIDCQHLSRSRDHDKRQDIQLIRSGSSYKKKNRAKDRISRRRRTLRETTVTREPETGRPYVQDKS